jgi:hypothetical protein
VKGAAGIFIDERADDRQAEVLPRIFGGQVGGFPALVAGLFTEGRQVRGIQRARITFEIAPDRAHWGTEIAGKVKAWVNALTYDGMAEPYVDTAAKAVKPANVVTIMTKFQPRSRM